MSEWLYLSKDECEVLYTLEAFGALAPLSPFSERETSIEQAELSWALSTWYQEGLLDMDTGKLSSKGKALFLPIIQPDSRLLLFENADEDLPFIEYYAHGKDIVQFSEQKGGWALSPIASEKILLQQLQPLFDVEKPPSDQSQATLSPGEFLLLFGVILLAMQQKPCTAKALGQLFGELKLSEELRFPILGTRYQEEELPPECTDEVKLQQTLERLAKDGILKQAEGQYFLEVAMLFLFRALLESPEMLMIREEWHNEKLSLLKNSVFLCEQGRLLGQLQKHQVRGRGEVEVVQLTSLGVSECKQMLNEFVRSRAYREDLSAGLSNMMLGNF